MSEHNVDGERLPPGTQPYDRLNGIRIGALAGGLVGTLVAALVGGVSFWWVLATAVVGGVVGYGYERRESAERGS